MAYTTPQGIDEAAAESGMAGIMQFGKERTDAMLAVQMELLEGYEESSCAWIERVKFEAELWFELAVKLSASASIPEGVDAYRECVSHRMQMAAEDGKRLFEDGQKIIGTLTKSFGNDTSEDQSWTETEDETERRRDAAMFGNGLSPATGEDQFWTEDETESALEAPHDDATFGNEPATGEDQSQTEDETKSAVERPGDAVTLPLLAEELSIVKETRETGRVRISTHTHEREALIDEDLARERVEIERIPIGRRIDAVPEMRQEGDTTIIPVVEERLVAERQVVLKEEILVTRVRTTERHLEKIPLRHQEAVITRYGPDPINPARRRLTQTKRKSRRRTTKRRSKRAAHRG